MMINLQLAPRNGEKFRQNQYYSFKETVIESTPYYGGFEASAFWVMSGYVCLAASPSIYL